MRTHSAIHSGTSPNHSGHQWSYLEHWPHWPSHRAIDINRKVPQNALECFVEIVYFSPGHTFQERNKIESYLYEMDMLLRGGY